MLIFLFDTVLNRKKNIEACYRPKYIMGITGSFVIEKKSRQSHENFKGVITFSGYGKVTF